MKYKYIYRGLVIVEYDADTQTTKFPDDEVFVNDTIQIAHITHIRYLTSTHRELAEFHTMIADHMDGLPVELKDIVVN